MSYRENKRRAITPTIGVTMTDQSGAEATDINVIVRKMNQTGMMPAGAKQPIYADFSDIPNNLKDMLDMSRNLEEHRSQLPEGLQGLSTAELINTPPARLQEMITEQHRYTERAAKLPQHLQSLSRQAVLSLTDEQMTNMITPPQPAALKPDVKT